MREFTEEHRKKIGEARRKWLAEHPEEKEKLRKAAKKWWKEHRQEMITSGVETSQLDDYTTYQREFQKQWRKKHPHYYRDLQRKRKEKKEKEKESD